MGGEQKNIQFSLVGDSTQTLKELAEDIIPILSRGKHLRDDAGRTWATPTASCRCT